ncbi:MAG: cupin domain-containing protein [Bacteroidetes bacterium]|nr:cupin domain-containing protein [Bacteroidota bacterium]
MTKNLFENIKPTSDKEVIKVLLQNKNITIERIVSYGFHTPDGYWYNEDKNEWVILLAGEAELEFKDGEIKKLKAGDYVLIPANQEHRVKSTSSEPNCIWLCFYYI